MKSIIKTLAAAAALALILAACNRESTGFGSGDGNQTIPENGTGYISLASSAITVEWSGENINNSTEGKEYAATRAGEPSVDGFTVELVRTQPERETIKKATYAEWKQMSEPIGVPFTIGGKQCFYQVLVNSGSTMADTAWEGTAGQPTYSGECNEFKLSAAHADKASAYAVPAITCVLESIKVSVSLEKNMAELSRDVKLEVKISKDNETESPYSLTYDEGHVFGVVYLDEDTHLPSLEGDEAFDRMPACGFLKPVADESMITLKVDLMYGDPDRGDVRISQDLPICTNAKANQYRRIMLYITHGEEDDLGKIVINAAVETWTYDEEVVVPAESTFVSQEVLFEEAIPDIDDRNAPRITSPDFTFDDLNSFDVSSYNTSGIYQPSAKIKIETVSPITRFAVRLVTDNVNLQSIYSMFGVNDTSVDLLSTDGQTAQAQTYMQSLGFPTAADIEGKTSMTVDIKNLLSRLYLYGGSHTLIIGITDNGADNDGVNKNYSRVELNLYYDSENGSAGDANTPPTITWPGKNMNNRYDVDPEEGLKVDIHISAPAGIEHLYVKMSGKIEAGLTGLMPTEFDLTDPEDAEEGLSDTLRGLKFPVGDDVKGENELLFDITEFMSMLKSFPGESDFELTVVDAIGQSVTSTIKLNVLEN